MWENGTWRSQLRNHVFEHVTDQEVSVVELNLWPQQSRATTALTAHRWNTPLLLLLPGTDMSRKAKEEYYRFFTVTDTRTHEKGHTEYKVTARVGLLSVSYNTVSLSLTSVVIMLINCPINLYTYDLRHVVFSLLIRFVCCNNALFG